MINYYKSEPDPIFIQFKEEIGHDNLLEDIRDYLLEEYSSNFTQFLELCSSPYDTSEYWKELLESEKDYKTIVDNLFQDDRLAKQQRYMTNVIISSGSIK